MNPNPGHFVHPREFVLVVRLMLMENNRQIERIVDLVNAPRFNNRKRLWRGDVGNILDEPCMREGFSTVVACGILGWERCPHVTLVLPLGEHHDVERVRRAQFQPRKGDLRGLIVGPTGIQTNAGGLVFPTAAVIGDVLEIRVVFKDKTVVGGKRKRVGEAPITRQNRTAFGGVEIDEQVSALKGGFPIGTVPTEEEHGLVPCHSKLDTVGVRLHQCVAVPVAEITVNGDVFRRCPLNNSDKKR